VVVLGLEPLVANLIHILPLLLVERIVFDLLIAAVAVSLATRIAVFDH
jgi:hypothetical protein